MYYATDYVINNELRKYFSMSSSFIESKFSLNDIFPVIFIVIFLVYVLMLLFIYEASIWIFKIFIFFFF